MVTAAIRSLPGLDHEGNIAEQHSRTGNENSSVDGKHISDFMGMRRGVLHREPYLPFGVILHGADALATPDRTPADAVKQIDI